MKTIKLYEETKLKILKFKKQGMSYDDVLNDFLDFFLEQNISPKDRDFWKKNNAKKATDSVVENSVKKVVDKKLSNMLFMVDEIHKKVMVEKGTIMTENTHSLTGKEITSLVEKIENDRKEGTQLAQKITELTTIVNDFSSKEDKKVKVDLSFLEQVISCAEALKSNKKIILGSNYFFSSKALFDSSITTIISLCEEQTS